ncbi:helix-turn-helix transcriptional regulator [Patulibacter minatonensis]|uniref:helix-turn-helix transcriptional regulator n=1 Tax=Patulibacter minatonensis TaxID=298163 RepID=UPI0004B16307|nr:LuxR family transcriptional regulator [Patulibacter minatonensis]
MRDDREPQRDQTAGEDPPLLDREGETAVLRRAVLGAIAGRGSLVVVEGPAGIGKSRLLREAERLLLEHAGTTSVRVLRGAGDELYRSRALGTVRGLRDGAGAPVRVAIASGDATDVPDGGAAAVQAVLGDLRAAVSAAGATLLVLDDVHWADAGSLRVVDELAADLDRLPLAIVVATRPAEPGAHAALLDRLRGRTGAAVVRPGPLGAAAVARLAGELDGGRSTEDVRRLVRRSGGNPFHVRELLRSGADDDGDVPDAVRRSVRADLHRLGPAATALARAVAVLGAGTPLRTAAALADLDGEPAERAADDLARVGILRPGDPLAFEHALIADAVRGELESFARARMHRRAATLLHEHGAPDDVVAAHLLETRAEGDAWVATTLLRAARATNAAGDPGAAGRLLERAVREPPPAALRGDVAGALAEVDALAGRPEAPDRLRQALEVIDDPRRRAELRYALSRAFHLAQRFDDAADASRAALDGLDPEDPLYDRVLAGWMTDAMFVPHLRPTSDPRAQAVTAGIRAGAVAAGPLVSHAVNMAALDGARGAVVHDLARRATSRDPLVDASAHGFPITHVATGLVHADLLDEEVTILGAAVDVARRRSNVLAEMTAIGGRAFGRHLRGDVGAALADASRAFAISRVTDTPYSAWWLLVVVECHLDAGAVDEAGAALRDADAVTIPAYAALRVREAEAAVALDAGDPERALRIAGEGEEQRGRFGGVRLDLGTRDGRWTMARALAAVGRHEEAARIADAEVARTADAPVARHRADALILQGAVRGADGVAPLEEAARLLRTSPARLVLLRAITTLGLARREAGDAAGAREALLEALELAERLGLAARADEVRSALRTVGARPRRAARRGPEALTAAELDVARLAALGLGNPEIAARRHVSRKTVETHLGRVYRKLGIATRDALRNALDDQGGDARGA